ncbi:hypothetical protein QJS10_CPA02g00884 [Acorus calamus]|uniref:FAD-binding domain-containing protein n=1 Tax=Acorus calamus TaxID=4465 RepID=A0AAV9FDZ8_ACOCL|nr:hypothetical protein QJS10_CPA02g00884 [Acorus calamus]
MNSSEHEIVIAGGGICGLATALALHRKGMKSIVLERSDTLRATGAAINVYPNGWHALDHLGIGSELRKKCVPITKIVDLYDGRRREVLIGKGELRSLKRSDLMHTLANHLPHETILFGQRVISVETNPETGFPILHCVDGTVINCKVLIGCEGVNSIVAKSLGMKAPSNLSICAIRAFTSYPNGHGFTNEFIRMKRGSFTIGFLPINEKVVHWFVGRPWISKDSIAEKDCTLLRDLTIDMMEGFPSHLIDMVRRVDLDSLGLTGVRYRPPWDLALGTFRRGTTVVAGDAMHVIAPFIGQGGSTAIEDAIVLARGLACAFRGSDGGDWDRMMKIRVERAMDEYLKERKLRLVRLSMQTYLLGLMFEAPSKVVKFVIIFTLLAFFGLNSLGHAQYDCGPL